MHVTHDERRGFIAWTAGLLLPLLAVGLSIVPGGGTVLGLNFAAVEAGQWYRIGTGHLMHWSAEHLFWDALACAVLGVMAARRSLPAYAACVAGSIAAIGLALAAEGVVGDYRGLSGIASGLFVLVMMLGAVSSLRQGRGGMAVVHGVMLAGFVAKVAFEYATGQTMFVQDLGEGIAAVPLAHVAGGLWGAGIAGLWAGVTGLGHRPGMVGPSA